MSDGSGEDLGGADLDVTVGTGRRELLKKVGVGAAVVWAAPTVLSVPAAAAATLPPQLISIPIFGSGDFGLGLGGIVMSADAKAWYTSDKGITWSAAASPPVEFSPIAVAEMIPLAVDGAGAMWRPVNPGPLGNTWAAVDGPPAGNPTLVAGFFNKAFATNAAGVSSSLSSNVWSADEVPLSAVLVQGTTVIALAGGMTGFDSSVPGVAIAIDDKGGAYRKAGTEWSAVAASPASVGVVPTVARGVMSYGPQFVAFDDAGNSAFSLDAGVTWNLSTTPIASLGGQPTIFAAAGLRVVALDGSGNTWRSIDGGDNFAPVAVPVNAVDPTAQPTAIVGAQGYGVVGTNGVGAIAAWHSTDFGDTWQAASTPPA